MSFKVDFRLEFLVAAIELRMSLLQWLGVRVSATLDVLAKRIPTVAGDFA